MVRSKKMRTLLIDADILVFRFAFRHQYAIEWANAVTSEVLDVRQAIRDLDIFIRVLLVKTQCLDYILCFTHPVNFRYTVFPAYKANRANLEPPKMLAVLKQHLLDEHPCRTQEWLEADDLMGILGTKYPDKYVLATIDKDFKSLPVILYNWNRKERPKKISKRRANYWFHYQWLTGDPTDGYKGVAGIGDKKAQAILKQVVPSKWTDIVVQTYADKCYSWEEICQQAQMARILRCEDYDHVNKKVKLWVPNC